MYVRMYIKRLDKNSVQKAFYVFEIFGFDVDAYMYVHLYNKKMFF